MFFFISSILEWWSPVPHIQKFFPARFDFLLPELHLPGLSTLPPQRSPLGVFHLPPHLDLARSEGGANPPGATTWQVDQWPHPGQFPGEDWGIDGRWCAHGGARGVRQLRNEFLRSLEMLEGWRSVGSYRSDSGCMVRWSVCVMVRCLVLDLSVEVWRNDSCSWYLWYSWYIDDIHDSDDSARMQLFHEFLEKATSQPHLIRIGWWENFNRKPLYLMVKSPCFPRFSRTQVTGLGVASSSRESIGPRRRHFCWLWKSTMNPFWMIFSWVSNFWEWTTP